MTKIKKFIVLNYRKLMCQKRKLFSLTLSAFIMLQMSTTAFDAGINDIPIVKGTEKLIGDVTTWLMVLAPVVAGMSNYHCFWLALCYTITNSINLIRS